MSKSANAVVVTNLSFAVTEDKLKSYLNEKFGATKSVSLATHENKRSKGYAFVEFEDNEACKKAIEAREFKLEGRLALIKQSTRQVTQRKRAPEVKTNDLMKEFERKKKTDDVDEHAKEKKRDKKRKMKADLKAMIASAVETADQGDTEEKADSKEAEKVAKSSNNDFKSMLFGS